MEGAWALGLGKPGSNLGPASSRHCGSGTSPWTALSSFPLPGRKKDLTPCMFRAWGGGHQTVVAAVVSDVVGLPERV